MRPRIRLDTAAAANMTRAARTALPNETGGILVGYYEGFDIVVTHALLIAPRRRLGNRYNRNATDANAALQDFLDGREHIDPVGYVGEWHTHPGPASPSSLDKGSICELARVAQDPLALIVVSAFGRSAMSVVVATRTRLTRVQFARGRRSGRAGVSERVKTAAMKTRQEQR
jgi:proteasome lid subunit RPN8/RPN11